MAFFVWCADRETEHDGSYMHATTPEDAAGGYVVAAIRDGKGFDELARDGGRLDFFVRDDDGVQRVRIMSHFSRVLLPG